MIFYLCISAERSWKQIYSNIRYVYVVLGRCRSYVMINMYFLGKGENEWKRKEYPDIPSEPANTKIKGSELLKSGLALRVRKMFS